mgnify:CR=1 FL=1
MKQWKLKHSITQKRVVKEVNADDDFTTDAPTELDGVAMTPGLVAKYHMNPSSAKLERHQITELYIR